ncbi:TonB-dependent receptor [Asticcacaulis solisilvae]|uniref:TonB-dependent receptor n=1 Tax=Asticcacaulis solisilvae TaxID=1217274 RepID=UPI003FD6EFD0
MHKQRVPAWMGLACVAAGLIFGAPAHAATPFTLDIPAGDAEGALRRLSAETGRAILLPPSARLSGRRSPALQGRFTLAEAMARLCPPAGLDCRDLGVGILVSLARPPAPVHTSAPLSVPQAGPEVVVTGRRGVLGLKEAELSYAVSHFSTDAPGHGPAVTVADALDGLPGLWVDTSAGTSGNQVRPRGIPLDGYGAIAILEDGLPVEHEPNLPWADPDQFYRPDDMLAEATYVRGGPASIFTSNAPGGAVDFTTRAAPDHAEGSAAVTTSDTGLARLDAHAGGPAGQWRLIVGGHVTRDPTERRLARPLGGGQVTARAERAWGSGHLSITVRHLDDTSLNTSSVPLQRIGGRIRPLPGFDPRESSWFGRDDGVLVFRTPRGPDAQLFRNNSGNRLDSLTVALSQALGPQTRLEIKARTRFSATRRFSFSSNGGAMTQGALASQFGGGIRFADTTGAAIGGDTLLAMVSPVAARVTVRETLVDASLSHRFTAFGDHDATVGVYGADFQWDYNRQIARALVEVADQGRLIDMTGPAGRITDHGIVNYGTTYEETLSDNHLIALYAADEWKLNDALRIDAGIRREQLRLQGAVERTATYNLGDASILADDAVQYGTGAYDRFGKSFSATAASAGLNWSVTRGQYVFARATRTFRMPGPGNYRGTVDPQGAGVLHMDQQELGYRFNGRSLFVSESLFHTFFRDIVFFDQVMGPQSGALIRRQQSAQAVTSGLESELTWQPSKIFRLTGALTVQAPRFRNYRFSQIQNGVPTVYDLDGRSPRRIPDVLFSLSPNVTLLNGRVVLSGTWQYLGPRFADDANTLKFPAVHLFSAAATADLGRGWKVDVRASNLGNALAIMQGDANGGEIVAAAGNSQMITARALPGRHVQLTLKRNW